MTAPAIVLFLIITAVVFLVYAIITRKPLGLLSIPIVFIALAFGGIAEGCATQLDRIGVSNRVFYVASVKSKDLSCKYRYKAYKILRKLNKNIKEVRKDKHGFFGTFVHADVDKVKLTNLKALRKHLEDCKITDIY